MGSVDIVGNEAVLNARSPISIAHGPDDRLLHRKGSVGSIDIDPQVQVLN